MSSYLKGARSASRTRQTEPIMNREREMTRNDAGGFAFKIDSLERLRRFLILGAEGGTYYASEAKHLKRNVTAVEQALHEHGTAAVDVMLAVSTSGRSASQDETLWALARAAAWRRDPVVMEYTLRRLLLFARTGFQLFQFCDFVSEMLPGSPGSNWSLFMRKGIAAWYEQRDDKCPHCKRVGTLTETVDLSHVGTPVCVGDLGTVLPPRPLQPPRRRDVLRCAGCTGLVEKRNLRGVDWLAYQVIKYRQRNGWTHARLIDLTHPVPPTPEHESVYQWVKGKNPRLLPEKIEGFQWAQLAETPANTVKVIKDRPWLPWEALRTEHTSDPDVVRALIDARVPMTALIRQLGRYTSYGVLKPMDQYSVKVAQQITDAKALTRARVHPFTVLKALVTYQAGKGFRMAWNPVSTITDALDEAFYASFGNAEVSGKRTLLAIDVSGSMAHHSVGGFESLTAREAAAAFALVIAAREPAHEIVAFSSHRVVQGSRWTGWSWVPSGQPDPDFYDPATPQDYAIKPLDISPRMRIKDACAVMRAMPAGGTDVSLPMRYAINKGLSVDTFVVLTDNESYAGRVHPAQALQHYRESTGIKDAKLVVVAMTATSYSVADPRDRNMLDVVGFDTSAPNLIAAFSRGEV